MGGRNLPIPKIPIPLIAAIVLFMLFAGVVWFVVGPTGVNTITLPEALPVIGGQQTNELVILAALVPIISGAIISASIPLLIIFRLLDNTVSGVKDDAAYKDAVAAAKKREKAIVKEYTKSQPPDPMPSHDESNWTAISSALTIGLFMAFFGAAFSGEFLGESNQFNISAGFAIVGIVAGLLALNGRRVRVNTSEEKAAVSGGAIWVVLTGFIVVGLGVGVMMWVRSQTG